MRYTIATVTNESMDEEEILDTNLDLDEISESLQKVIDENEDLLGDGVVVIRPMEDGDTEEEGEGEEDSEGEEDEEEDFSKLDDEGEES